MKSVSRDIGVGWMVVIICVGVVLGLYLRARQTPKLMPPIQLNMPPLSEWQSYILGEMDWGRVEFNAPENMRYEQPKTVELSYLQNLSISDLQAQLQQKANVASARVQITDRMEAKISGKGFAIEPLAPAIQGVTSHRTTSWRWEVTPTEHGPQTLHAVVFAYIDVAGHDTPYVIRTIDKEIRVDITIPQRILGFIEKNWQWLWAAVVVPVAGYLWRRKTQTRL